MPVYKAVDTCAAEFAAETPYFYSTYEDENEALPGERERVVILGSGPNRIGQGIEFDYCCVHAAMTVREAGYEAIMVNCNPETVSTDYDVSDRLYFEPLTFEDVANIVANERPRASSCSSAARRRCKHRRAPGRGRRRRILGTPHEAIDLAEDRGRFGELLEELGIKLPALRGGAQPRGGGARRARSATRLLVRPSYVLGGRAMQIVYGDDELSATWPAPWQRQPRAPRAHRQVPRRRHRGRRRCRLRRRGGLRRRRSCSTSRRPACTPATPPACIPSISLGEGTLEQVRRQTAALARALGVRGLMNVQFAYQNYELYVLEVNPRASRTVPFVSKATGVQLAKLATRVILGAPLRELGLRDAACPST